jgi:RNase P protein component
MGRGTRQQPTKKYDCAKLKKERDRLRAEVNKTNVWPASKRDQIKRHYREF